MIMMRLPGLTFVISVLMFVQIEASLAQTTGPGARAQPKMLRPPVPGRSTPRPATTFKPGTVAPRGPSLSTQQDRDVRARLRTLNAEYRRRIKSDGKFNADIWLRARQQQIRQDAPGR